MAHSRRSAPPSSPPGRPGPQTGAWAAQQPTAVGGGESERGVTHGGRPARMSHHACTQSREMRRCAKQVPSIAACLRKGAAPAAAAALLGDGPGCLRLRLGRWPCRQECAEGWRQQARHLATTACPESAAPRQGRVKQCGSGACTASHRHRQSQSRHARCARCIPGAHLPPPPPLPPPRALLNLQAPSQRRCATAAGDCEAQQSVQA